MVIQAFGVTLATSVAATEDSALEMVFTTLDSAQDTAQVMEDMAMHLSMAEL